jgi:hypothetical protein
MLLSAAQDEVASLRLQLAALAEETELLKSSSDGAVDERVVEHVRSLDELRRGERDVCFLTLKGNMPLASGNYTT